MMIVGFMMTWGIRYALKPFDMYFFQSDLLFSISSASVIFNLSLVRKYFQTFHFDSIPWSSLYRFFTCSSKERADIMEDFFLYISERNAKMLDTIQTRDNIVETKEIHKNNPTLKMDKSDTSGSFKAESDNNSNSDSSNIGVARGVVVPDITDSDTMTEPHNIFKNNSDISKIEGLYDSGKADLKTQLLAGSLDRAEYDKKFAALASNLVDTIKGKYNTPTVKYLILEDARILDLKNKSSMVGDITAGLETTNISKAPSAYIPLGPGELVEEKLALLHLSIDPLQADLNELHDELVTREGKFYPNCEAFANNPAKAELGYYEYLLAHSDKMKSDNDTVMEYFNAMDTGSKPSLIVEMAFEAFKEKCLFDPVTTTPRTFW